MEINGKIFKHGSGYAICIPKALVDSKILQAGKRYKFEVNSGGWILSHFLKETFNLRLFSAFSKDFQSLCTIIKNYLYKPSYGVMVEGGICNEPS